MRARCYVQIGVLLVVLLVFEKSGIAALWQDPVAIPSYRDRAFFSFTPGGTLNFVDYAVYAPGDYDGSITFSDELYVYAYQVTNSSGSTVGIDYFSVGMSPDVQVPNVAYDPAMSYAIPGGINPTMHFKLPESVIYLYLTDNIGAGECSMTLLFTSNYGPEMSYGYVSGGVMGGAIVDVPSPVPEPATIALLSGSALLALRRRRNG